MFAPSRPSKPAHPARLAAALLAFAIWALTAGCAVWWWLRAGSQAAAPAAPVAAQRAQQAIDSAAVARALGAGAPAAAQSTAAASASAPAAAADGRFALRGVLTHGMDGAALIAVEGKTRAVPLGAALGKDAEGWELREVQPHAVLLVAGGREVRLEMPDEQERARILKSSAAHAAAGAAATPARVPHPDAARAEAERTEASPRVEITRPEAIRPEMAPLPELAAQ